MTRHATSRTSRENERGGWRHAWVALLVLVSGGWLGCFSLPTDGNICLHCESECPGDLVCREGRCVRSCSAGCPEDMQCGGDGICVYSSGEPLCKETTLTFNICVGREVAEPVMGASSNDLVILESRLPRGLHFDPDSGEIVGTPERESTGQLSLRNGDVGGLETTVEVTATLRCVDIVSGRIEWCAGNDQRSELQASDAREDYTWQVEGLPSGATQNGAELSGNVPTPATYSLSVTLREGAQIRAEGRVELVVGDCEMAPPLEPDPDAGPPPPDGGAPVETEPVRIVTASLGQACAGQSYVSEPLVANGGDGNYHWSLESNDFIIDESTGVISGTPLVSGHVELPVRVQGTQSEDEALVGIEVLPEDDERCSDPPPPIAIVTRELVTGCVGVPYSAPALAASGGNGVYAWSLINPPEWLEVDPSGELFGTPDAPVQTQLRARVDASGGGYAEATLELRIFAAGAGDCALPPLTIGTTELPVACVGLDYSPQRLEVSGGSGNYRWRATNLPAGMALSEEGVLSGTPTAQALGPLFQLTVSVNSTGVLQTQSALTLPVIFCNPLVFIGDDSGVDRLFHVTPPYEVARELSSGLLGVEEDVRSFRVPSRTSKLAFVVAPADTTRPARMYLADSASGQVRAIEWPTLIPPNASVLDYVWSPNGEYLAVVVGAAQQILLATVRGESGQVTAAVGATYRSKLFAVADQLCYLADGVVTRQRDVYCHSVIDSLVSASSLRRGTFLASLIDDGQFVPGAQGYLAIPGGGGDGDYRSFVDDLGFNTIDHVFSSTLRWAIGSMATPGQNDLVASDLYNLDEEPVVLSTLPTCEVVLAWSKDERTLVCTSAASLRIFEFDEDGRVLHSVEVEDSLGYTENHDEARRAFSSDGRWFAYEAGSALRLIDTQADLPRSTLVVEHPQLTSVTGLQFSSDSTALFYHRGSQLDVLSLEDRELENWSGSVLLSAPLPCTLLYLDAGPDQWCGSNITQGSFFPSPNGSEVAFLDPARRLYVASAPAASKSPRPLGQQPVKCTTVDDEIRCDVAWAPSR